MLRHSDWGSVAAAVLLLLILVVGPLPFGSVMPRERLLCDAWGYESPVETNAVDVYVGYLRRKLEEGGEPRLIHTVRGVGFVLRMPPAD